MNSTAAGKGKIRPIRVEGDVAYVTLTQGFEAVIDAADAPLVAPWNWHVHIRATGQAYAHRGFWRRGRRISIGMHRQLLGVDGPPIDHASGDGLDNRRANLRECTASQNMANMLVQRRKRIPLKGVSERRGKFHACIQANGVTYCLGTYSSAAEASAAYMGAAKVLHGEFARAA